MPPAREFHCGDEDLRQRPAQVLRGLRSGHEPSGGRIRVVEPSRQRECENLAEPGREAEQAVDLDLATMCCQLPDLVAAPPRQLGRARRRTQPIRSPTEAAISRRRRCPTARSRHRYDSRTARTPTRSRKPPERGGGRGDPLPQHVQEFIGPVRIAECPERIADEQAAPQQELPPSSRSSGGEKRDRISSASSGWPCHIRARARSSATSSPAPPSSSAARAKRSPPARSARARAHRVPHC